MRKHFLLLFLMAILPLAGWADEPAAYTGEDALVYSGEAQALVSQGEDEGFTYYYAVITAGEDAPALEDYGTYAAKAKATNAGAYVVYYVKKEGDGPLAAGDLNTAQQIATSIAVGALDVKVYLDDDVIATLIYNAAVYEPIVKVGDTEVEDGVDHYSVSWSATIKNTGGYTVTVKLYDGEDQVVNAEGTASITVLPKVLNVSALNQTTTYGLDAVEVKDLYTATGWQGEDGANDELTNLAVTVTYGESATQPTAAGPHTFTIHSNTALANYTVNVQVASATLTINKADLTITADDLAGIVYGAPEPTWTSSFEGLIDDDADNNGQPKAGVLNGTLAYTVVRTDPEDGLSYWDEENPGAVGTYSITPKIVDAETDEELDPDEMADNYNIIIGDPGEFTIAQKALTAITVANIPSQEYSNAELTPVYSLKDGAKDLVEDIDFEVSITYNNEDATPKNAKTYKVTFTGIGNYKSKVTKNFVITKAPLTILIKDDLTKVYDGNAYAFNDAWDTYCQIYGVKNNEAYTEAEAEEDENFVFTAEPYLTYDEIGGSKTNVNNYVVTLAQVGSANYDVVVEDGALAITPMPIYLKADDKSQVFGKAAKDLTYSIYPDADFEEEALEAEIANGEVDETGYLATAPALVKAGGTDYGTYDITFSTAATATSNYQIVSSTKGTYSITKANLRIIAENKEQTYDGTVSQTLTFKVVGLIDGDHITTNPTLTKAEPTNADAGVYTITAAGAVVDHPNNYGDITYQTGTYTIYQKKLTITAKKQGLLVGETAEDLDNTLVSFDGLIPADKGKVTVTLGFDPDLVDTDDETHEIEEEQTHADEDGVIAGGIIITAVGGEKADNYFTSEVIDEEEVSYLVAGNLLITDDETEPIIINPVSKATWTAATSAQREDYGWKAIKDADAKKVTVKFASFTMKAEQWYTMVLPFKTNVAEISSKLGYAVVNVLNTSNSSDEVKFKLHMQDIEANEPFLVKVYKEIDLADLSGDAEDTDDPLTFARKTIEYVETPSVADAKGTKYIGTFMGYQTDAKAKITDEYYMSISDFIWHNAKDGGYTRPSGAYLKVAEGVHARILIEEPDGTTSIQTITANGEMVPAQGWYTLNGVKLQGVPTEKGIYINNGKKVVIK